ncbi:FAD-dependent oxidoreductase [Clostridium sp. FP2]|uniref:FAD-dependent oxidoreductase n=1 Tax=Clostridium TaxID=1485 RepID=UPI0013E94923|nr:MULTISPECIES: FAD-dependent oxidoreductase [Clostridium]MBW9155895.1 FAD-dependent oxidoreductase [Clostridium tagluense]MBZ9624053.1 FAD-dependent oxidoreductase [Clostridium sp. FP2]MCB2298346.1 FAD-dependent oxidoreductase [Clostridium tagluense]WLC63946.1 FAD-dependent oxidoreductase [Clostridium tagluense]
MSEKKRIAILGGGYGGVLTAKKLAKKFKKDEEVEITLIDQNPYHTLLTELHEVAAGRVSEDAIRIDFKKIFAKRKVKVVLDEITDLDFKNNVLKSENNTYEYDYLVIGAGCKPTYFGVKGAEEFCHKLWSFEDAVALKEHILKMFRKAVKEKNKEERKKLLTFIVVGGGFTGVEMMGELGEWKERLCKDFYIEQEEVTLILADDLPKILPNFPDKLIAKTKKRLNKLGVTVLTNAGVTEVTGDTATIRNNGIVNTYTVIWTAGVEGSDIIGKMDIQQKGRKRIVTDDKLRSLDYKNVYVVGDNIFFIPEGEERPLPQMVENAEESAALIAHNVYTDIKGGEKKSYKPSFHGAMVCVGGKYGVANVGAGKNFFALSGFFALFVKHFINIVYFIQVAGFNKCWSYLLHEFFHVKDNRSFVGGYFSKSSPNFWLLVLRMFVGYKWLTEGLEKLPKIIADPSKIFLIPAPVVDGATAATAAAPAAGAAPVATWVALPVPGFIEKIVKWSMDTFFYTGDGGYTVLATIFQTGMVIAEILVGIMLIVGLFSALASLMSVAMGIMIWTSGMAPTEMLWYLSAGIALIGGSGSTFGMDYYVLPILKKYWKSIGWVKKSYLYVD